MKSNPKLIRKSLKQVWKYRLEKSITELDLCNGFKIVCAHEQDEVCTLWIEQDTDAPTTTVTFAIVGTGHDVPADGHHVGTCFIDPMVWHIYQIEP